MGQFYRKLHKLFTKYGETKITRTRALLHGYRLSWYAAASDEHQHRHKFPVPTYFSACITGILISRLHPLRISYHIMK